MLEIIVFVALPPVSIGKEGQAWRQEESLMDLEVGATSSQLAGHESTHPGASEVQ